MNRHALAMIAVTRRLWIGASGEARPQLVPSVALFPYRADPLHGR